MTIENVVRTELSAQSVIGAVSQETEPQNNLRDVNLSYNVAAAVTREQEEAVRKFQHVF